MPPIATPPSSPGVAPTGAAIYDKGGDRGHRSYNDPSGVLTGTKSDSSIGPQIRTDYYAKKALIDLKKDMFFGPLADTTSMPKHFGKTIKKYHYLPLLDDRNVNDQGIDAAGSAVVANNYWEITSTGVTKPDGTVIAADVIGRLPCTAADEPYALPADAVAWWNAEYPDGVNFDLNKAASAALITSISGNLYGSSKDPGVITSKMPALSEHGGRVNRVGFKRIELEGTLEKFGFFDEYTQESIDFDTDSDLMMHVNREMLRGANEITEDALQIDLLNNAGVRRYAGAATDRDAVGAGVKITYDDLQQLSIDLDDNRCPKNTKRIFGSRMIDTRTINEARYLHIGSDLKLVYKNMRDVPGAAGEKVFIPAQQYGAATTIVNGEIGSVDEFRIVVVPEMMFWQKGNNETGTALVNSVYPSLVIGSGSFTTIGFQTDGKTVKFKITHKKPGKDVANRDDPYGEIGFMSIKWYYGFMVLRPEWLAVLESAK